MYAIRSYYEEGGGGEVMVREGVMDRFGIAQVYGIHNAPNVPVITSYSIHYTKLYDEDGSETEDDGTGDIGQARVIVLETCLPDGAAISLRFAGMPGLFHAPDVAAMVAKGAIVLPEVV